MLDLMMTFKLMFVLPTCHPFNHSMFQILKDIWHYYREDRQELSREME